VGPSLDASVRLYFKIPGFNEAEYMAGLQCSEGQMYGGMGGAGCRRIGDDDPYPHKAPGASM
jgi:hypothetical protein